MMRIDRFLAQENFGTRKHTKRLIKTGAVTIDDEVINNPGHNFNPELSTVCVAGEIIKYTKTLFFLLNKPKGYLCSSIDEKYPSVLRLLPAQYEKRLKIVGRLDVDTTGVLLLTSDGNTVNYLTHPKNGVTKTYLVKTNHEIPSSMVSAVKSPIDIGHREMSAACDLKIIEPTVAEITLSEGKYHEVKRLFHAFNLEVLGLDRISFYHFDHENVDLGCFRELTDLEIEELLKRVYPYRHLE